MFKSVRLTSDDEISAFILADYFIYVDNTCAYDITLIQKSPQNLIEYIDLIHAPTIFVKTVDKTKSESTYDDIWREMYQIRD